MASEIPPGSNNLPRSYWQRMYLSMTSRMLVLVMIAILLTSCSSEPAGKVVAESGAPATATLRILNWNVLYGFNHANSIEQGVAWIADQKPDVVALQELNGNTAESLQGLAAQWGHEHSVLLKQDGFPVGLTSTAPIEVIERRVEGFHHGYLHCRTHDMQLFVVHFWPGKDHEAAIVLDKIKLLLEQNQDVVVAGDFNTHSRNDARYLASRTNVKPLYDVVDLFESHGLVDLVHKHSPESLYSCPSPITIPSWSSSREELESKRQRIDFVLADSRLAQYSVAADIRVSEELDGISDHYPVVVEFLLPAAQ